MISFAVGFTRLCTLPFLLEVCPGVAWPARCNMPNGGSVPYRLGHGTPSPVHTSDSEDTYNNKMRWRWLGRKVLYRLRLNLRRKRCERWTAMLGGRNLLPADLPMVVVRRIAEFLG